MCILSIPAAALGEAVEMLSTTDVESVGAVAEAIGDDSDMAIEEDSWATAKPKTAEMMVAREKYILNMVGGWFRKGDWYIRYVIRC